MKGRDVAFLAFGILLGILLTSRFFINFITERFNSVEEKAEGAKTNAELTNIVLATMIEDQNTVDVETEEVEERPQIGFKLNQDKSNG